jgi:hypothetical protein
MEKVEACKLEIDVENKMVLQIAKWFKPHAEPPYTRADHGSSSDKP